LDGRLAKKCLFFSGLIRPKEISIYSIGYYLIARLAPYLVSFLLSSTFIIVLAVGLAGFIVLVAIKKAGAISDSLVKVRLRLNWI
jgi:hypothetical protein